MSEKRSSVWFNVEVRVRVEAGTSPQDATGRLQRCVVGALEREYGEDFKYVRAAVNSDPSEVLSKE